MSKSALYATLGLLGLAMADLQSCGDKQYDPTQYVCYGDNFLCPIVAGEALSYCSGACYSKFMYTCTDSALEQLPTLAAGTPFTLTASNPAAAAVDGLAVNACGLRWNVGGPLCTYCPSDVVPSCPAGTSTVVTAGSSSAAAYAMDVEVPGGQQIYLDASWAVGYTQAHSAYLPSGSLQGGLVAYAGDSGGLVNLNSGGWGWAVCAPTGTNSGYTLYAANSTNQAALAGCTPVNLKVAAQASGTVGAWQYT